MSKDIYLLLDMDLKMAAAPSREKRKRCSKCERTLSVSKFYKNKSKKDGLTTECKECCKRRVPAGKRREKYLQYQRDYNKRNREKRRAQSRARYKKQGVRDGLLRRLKKLGITYKDYQELAQSQENRCGICGKKSSDKYRGKPRSLHIDHCHTTGKIRGLLCATCNHGIGNFYDNPLLLKKAISYLKKHERN